MDSKEEASASQNGPESAAKPAKRQRKVAFFADTGVDPSSCITLRLVSSAKDMQDNQGIEMASDFASDFSEHFFGEEGKIYGYKDLQITIWFHALTFHAHMDISYSEKQQDVRNGKHQVTDLEKIFKEVFGAGLVEDRDVFLQSIDSNNQLSVVSHQYGKRLASWRKAKDQESGQAWIKVDDAVEDVSKEILLLDLSAAEVMDWHSRLTPLVLMFIEGGRPIENKDSRWEVLVDLEKVSSEPESPWRLVGFCTVYNFFKYPDSTRIRISQILVLPPYQGRSNGLELLKAVYQVAAQCNCYEVTMEEPSEKLQELRDCMDVLRILAFETARSYLQTTLVNLRTICVPQESVEHENFEKWMPSPGLVEAVRKNLKISKAQFQRCWDVLLFLHLRENELHAQEMFKNLVAWRVKLEIFGKSKSKKVDDNKRIIDTENIYDSSKTFVMLKTRPSSKIDSNGSTQEELQYLQDAVDVQGQVDTEKELQELISEREEEIERVAEKVSRHLASAGTSLVTGV